MHPPDIIGAIKEEMRLAGFARDEFTLSFPSDLMIVVHIRGQIWLQPIVVDLGITWREARRAKSEIIKFRVMEARQQVIHMHGLVSAGISPNYKPRVMGVIS